MQCTYSYTETHSPTEKRRIIYICFPFWLTSFYSTAAITICIDLSRSLCMTFSLSIYIAYVFLPSNFLLLPLFFFHHSHRLFAVTVCCGRDSRVACLFHHITKNALVVIQRYVLCQDDYLVITLCVCVLVCVRLFFFFSRSCSATMLYPIH